MPTLKKTEFSGEVVWLGHVPGTSDDIRSGPADQIDLGFEGQAGARHQGANRASCVRVSNLYAEGTEIRNVRQLTILSAEQLDAIAAEMGLASLDPGLLGATIVVRGIPDFTHIPPASRLQAPSGLTLTVDMENRPCLYPAREIEMEQPGHGAAFKPAAKNRRGVTAWVERPGSLCIGDTVSLFIPDQREWNPS